MTTQARVHHYVPQWYQKRFLKVGQTKYHYLDLHPETVVNGNIRYQRRNLLHWGPAGCFCKDDLYTFTLGKWSTDQIEKMFFGAVDTHGRKAVEFFGDYSGYAAGVHEAFPVLPQYMDAQRFRTPRRARTAQEENSSDRPQPNAFSDARAVSVPFDDVDRRRVGDCEGTAKPNEIYCDRRAGYLLQPADFSQ